MLPGSIGIPSSIRTFHIGRQSLIRGRKLVTDKRFLIGASGFVLIRGALLDGQLGVNWPLSIVQTRMSQGQAIAEAQTLKFQKPRSQKAPTMPELTAASEKGLTEARDILRGIRGLPWFSLCHCPGRTSNRFEKRPWIPLTDAFKPKSPRHQIGEKDKHWPRKPFSYGSILPALSVGRVAKG